MFCSDEQINETRIRTVQDKGEPVIDIVPGSYMTIPIILTIMCDYSTYECSETEIEFADTVAFEVFINLLKY